jgi:hypothetical protein
LITSQHLEILTGYLLAVIGSISGFIPAIFKEEDRRNIRIKRIMQLSNEHKEQTTEWKRLMSLRNLSARMTDKRFYALAFGLVLIGTTLMSLNELL